MIVDCVALQSRMLVHAKRFSVWKHSHIKCYKLWFIWMNEFEASRKTIHLLKLYQPNNFRSKEIWLKNLIFFSVHVLKSITFRYGRCFQCCKRNTLPVFQQKTKGKSIRNVHWQAKYYLLPATGFQLRKVHQRV